MSSINVLPLMNTDQSETGCCPRFNPEPWEKKEIIFKDKLFARATTNSFMYVPLNMGKVMTLTMKAISDANAQTTDGYLILSNDFSPWKCAHYFAVSKEVHGLEMVKLSGKYLTRVFEGTYGDVSKWMKEMDAYVKSQNAVSKKVYSFYTTCPKCAKAFGKNYVVLFAEI